MANDDKPGDALATQHVTPTHANGGAAAANLTSGSIYHGIVGAHNDNGTYSVTLAKGLEITNVERVMPSFCSLIGVKDLTVLYPGTPVVISYGQPSFILGTRDTDVPGETPGRSSQDRRMVLGDRSSRVQQAAADALTGDFELANALNVGVRFLTTVMQMSAGDRAKVECHLINDMVRIVSAQYRHHSPMGDELMFDHGRPTTERGWTSYRHELFGCLDAKDPLYEETKLLNADRMQKVGRHRLIEFIGYAGDMIHSFIADPAKAVLELADMSPASGKSWVHRAMDGSVIVQSTADIRMERVVRIPVPMRITSHEDPTLKRHYDTMTGEMKAYLKTWDMKNPQRMAFQLREYSRWLTRFSAFARFLMHPEEYSVPTESDTPAPDGNNGEADRREVNGDIGPFDTYSVISINRNGSIVLFGSGASVVMNYGDIHVSATKHVTVESAGDLRLVSGGSIFLKARKHIEMTASAGAIIMYSYTAFRALCDAGAMLLKSCMKPKGDNATPRYPADRDSTDADMQPDVQSSAITLDTPSANTVVRALTGVTIATEAPVEGDNASNPEYLPGAITLSSSGNIRTKAGISQTHVAEKDMTLTSTRQLVTLSRYWVGRSDYINFNDGNIFINPGLGEISCNKLHAGSTYSYGPIYGPDQSTTSRASNPSNVPAHLNHINLFSDPAQLTAGRPKPAANETASTALGFAGTAQRQKVVPWTGQADGVKWGFLPKPAYSWSGTEGVRGSLIETLGQQLVRLEAYGPDADTGKSDKTWLDWVWAGNTLAAATDSNLRHDKNAAMCFGQDAPIFRQEQDAAFPSLFSASSQSADDYKNAFASVDSHWQKQSHSTFKTFRPS